MPKTRITNKKITKAIEDDEIGQELVRLKGLFEGAEPAKLDLYDNLLKRAAFLSVTLQRLEVEMVKNGVIEEYRNGANQSGRKRSSEAGLYCDFQKIFLSTMKELRTALGDSLKHEPDEFEMFMADYTPQFYEQSSGETDEQDEFDKF